MTGLTDGGFLVSWTADGLDGSGQGVYGQRYHADGTTDGGAFLVNVTTAGNQFDASITARPDGGFVVAWTSDGQDGDGDGIYAQLYNGSPPGPQTLTGTAANDSLVGGDDNDSLSGTAGDDFLQGGAGSDILDGGSGTDTAVYGGNVADYAISNSNGSITITDTNATDGDDGTDSLTNIETLSFVDGDISVVDLPDAYDGTVSLPSGATASGQLSATDAQDDAASLALSYAVASQAAHGTVTVNADGSYSYQADAGYVGSDAFQYQVTDSDGHTDVATVSVDVWQPTVTMDNGSSEFRANSTTTGNQNNTAATFLSDGGYVVVWTSYDQDGDQWGVYGQRYDPAGGAVGSEFQISQTTAGSQDVPSISALSDGGFFVSWQSPNQDGSLSGIFGRRYNATGAPLANEFQINTTTAGDQIYARTAAFDGGGFVVAWMSNDQDGDKWGVYGQRYDNAGAAIGSEFLINTTTADSQIRPSLVTFANGEFMAVWRSYGQDGDNYGVFGQRFDATGVKVGGEFQINTTTAGSQGGGTAARLSNGGFVVVWNSDGSHDGDGAGVYGQRFDSAGVKDGGEFRINETTAGDQNVVSFRDHVAALPDGGFMVTWYTVGQDGSGLAVYGRRYDASGSAVGGEFQVNDYTTNNQVNPSIAADDTGRILVTWTSVGQDGDSGGVYAKTYNLTVLGQDLVGSSISDALVGANGDDTLSGAAGDDFLTGGSGDDVLDGGSGSDTAVYGGNVADYVISNSNGAITITDANAADGDDGTDSLTNVETLSFGDGDISVEDLPDASDGTVSLPSGATASGQLSATDAQDDAASLALSYSLSAQAAHGTVTVNADGSYSYQADAGYVGSDAFQYQVTDSDGHTDVAEVSVEVRQASDSLVVAPEFQVNSFTSGNQSSASLATFSDDGFVTVWQSGSQIKGQRYDAAGEAVGGEFQINTYTAGLQRLPSVTVLSDDGFVVVWDSPNHEASGNYEGIFGQRFDAGGTKLGGEFQVNSYGHHSQFRPVTASLSDGGFVVVWNSHAQDGDDSGVYGQRYDAAGNMVGGEFHISTATQGHQYMHSVAGLAGGGFVATWEGAGQDGSPYSIYGQRYDAAGGKAGGEFQVNSSTSGYQQRPSIASLADGGFVATWRSGSSWEGDGSAHGIYGQRYDAAGATVGSEFLINDGGGATDLLSPSVTGLTDGGFLVSWTADGLDGSGSGVYGQRYDAVGVADGGAFPINLTTAGDQSEVDVAGRADGGFVAAWTSDGQDGENGGVYAQLYNGSLPGPQTLTGTAANDSLVGGDDDDTLNGEYGDDFLTGGAGSDILDGGSGTDTAVYSSSNASVTVDLMTGVAAGGEAEGDVLLNIENTRGSAFDDIIKGNNGTNTLDGGAGNDTLIGRDGGDKYLFGRSSGVDQILEEADGSGSDIVSFGENIATEQVWFLQDGLDLEVSVIGTNDKLLIDDWFDNSSHQIEEFRTSDGALLSNSDVQMLVDAMAAFSPPAFGQETLPTGAYQDDLLPVIAASWQSGS